MSMEPPHSLNINFKISMIGKDSPIPIKAETIRITWIAIPISIKAILISLLSTLNLVDAITIKIRIKNDKVCRVFKEKEAELTQIMSPY